MELQEADRLLDPAPMMIETGVERLDSGGLRVAARTDMLDCRGEMFEWWFQSAPDTGRYAWWRVEPRRPHRLDPRGEGEPERR